MSFETGLLIKGFAVKAGLPEDMPLRIDIIGGADSGFAYELYFDRPGDGDIVISTGGRQLAVSPDVAYYLDGSTIDWVASENGSGFYIDNPNEPDKT
ncbi:hypothetical protein AOG23_33745 [Rhizobium acidisoli]|nr:hypothetical protein AOG23_33745 [Rhizobium acidisoli]